MEREQGPNLLTGTPRPIGKLTVREWLGQERSGISILHMRHRKVKVLGEGHPAQTSGSAVSTALYDRPKDSLPWQGSYFPAKKGDILPSET